MKAYEDQNESVKVFHTKHDPDETDSSVFNYVESKKFFII